MTPEERDLITDLFDRMRRQGLAEIDDEAAELIARSMRASPDAAYQLVQTVIVQNMALERAEQKIADLEDEVRAATANKPARSSGGSFLGGIFGGGREADAGASTARHDVDSSRSSIGGDVLGARARTRGNTTPWSSGRAAAPERGARGGGFLGTAMTTAAGVAGGMLLADGIRGLFNDTSATAHAADASKATAETPAANESAGGASGASETTEASTAGEGGGFFDGLFGGGGDDGGDDLLDI